MSEAVVHEVRSSVRAWWVVAATMAALVAAAGFRSSTGVLLEPLEHEFGWSRGVTSGAASLNLILFGLTAPFAAALMERFGVCRSGRERERWPWSSARSSRTDGSTGTGGWSPASSPRPARRAS